MTPTPEPTAAALPTERIRMFYVHATAWATYSDTERPDLVRMREAQAAEFDRWLASHDAQVAEKAWDEAVAMCCQMLGARNVNWPNPYRKAAPDGNGR